MPRLDGFKDHDIFIILGYTLIGTDHVPQYERKSDREGGMLMSDDLNRRQFSKTATLLAAAGAVGPLFEASGAKAQTKASDYYALSRRVERLEIPQAVTVIGIGGHGSWPALFSSLSGIQSILITDMARVEDLDIGRTPYRPSDVGRLKTDALTDVIHFFRPDINILTNSRRLEPGDNDIFHGQVLF